MSFAIWQQTIIVFLLVLILITQIRVRGKRETIQKLTQIRITDSKNQHKIALLAQNSVKKMYEDYHTACTIATLEYADDMQNIKNPLFQSKVIQENNAKLIICARFNTFRSYELVHIDCTREIYNNLELKN
jgi:hypothetical protein